MKSITALTKKDLKGKTVLLRLGLNVPLKNGKVLDSFRIKKSLPSIKYLKKAGARVVIISHIGRGTSDSLAPVARHMNKYIKTGFVPGRMRAEIKDIVSAMKDGTVLMLESLRVNSGEIKNSEAFAKKLAELADIYVNDAFSASHREHASIVGVPKLLPSFSGLLFEEEIKNLSLLNKPKKPFLFILGGAKFKTKIPLIKKYLRKADNVFVGGALANNFYKTLGFETGKSLTEKVNVDMNVFLKSRKLILPTDLTVKNGKSVSVKRPSEVLKTDLIVDAGPETVSELVDLVRSAKTVVINGPIGNYEIGFDKNTRDLLRVIANTENISIVGGGDTAYLAYRTKCDKKCTFISTGGGAMIEFLLSETLPGIKALK